MNDTTRAYYVSVRQPGKYGLLLGPYATHGEALANVERATRFVVDRDPRAHWYEFGTASTPIGNAQPGKLNELIGVTA